MSKQPRLAKVRAPAKINLSLKVLGKRPDGFHELRTVFQTISPADILEIEFLPARTTRIELVSNIDIPDNLVSRAVRLVLETTGARGRVRMRLDKRIPMGGGLGGGSTDAAAVLLALPVLAGRDLSLGQLVALASELGSDVPFFLLGGTALGLGRGTELYPLPDAGPAYGLLVTPDIHVSTAEAYRALERGLTLTVDSNSMNSFRALCWSLERGTFAEGGAREGENDFESFAFRRYPQLARIRRKLKRLGARPVMLSGSGSSVFGIFGSRGEAEQARIEFRGQRTESFYLVSRARYHRMWWRSLLGHLRKETWPPRSRYAR